MRKNYSSEKTVIGILERTAEACPDKTAIKDTEGALTYSQLKTAAKDFGYALYKALDGRRQLPVVLFMDKSCSCFAAMLGTLYSGNVYVPMDVKTPVDRLFAILESLGENIVVADEGGRARLEKIGFTGPVTAFEELMEAGQTAETGGDSEELKEAVLEEIKDRVIDTDLMYILFTSGSTGMPKGVAITHRSVMDYMRAFMAETPIEQNDVVGNQTPFYADMSLKDLYMSICAGATICVIPQKYFMTPKKLLQYLDDNSVTILMWVPTAYNIVSRFDALSKIRPGKLQKLFFSGESMPIPVFRYWKTYYPDAAYFQLYGPTEITGACTYYKVTRDYEENEMIPIGKPYDNTGIILLNENDELVSDKQQGVRGEICVYGSCLAAGYYNDLEKTRAAFVQNPLVSTHPLLMYRTGDIAQYDENGDLVFVSRKDYQIKHGGRRVELGEIEAGIYKISEVAICCCVHNTKKDEITAYYTGEVEPKELKIALKRTLPQYMLPAECVKMEDLPRLPSGKLDRKRMTEWASEEEK